MSRILPILLLAHVIGLAWAMGAASVKLGLLVRCRVDRSLIPSYLSVVRPVTAQLVAGMILLTLSGVAWLFAGYELRGVLAVKVALVAAVWVLGPVIDKVAEPRFRRLAPAAGEPASVAFLRAERGYLSLEAIATALFYVIAGIWVLH